MNVETRHWPLQTSVLDTSEEVEVPSGRKKFLQATYTSFKSFEVVVCMLLQVRFCMRHMRPKTRRHTLAQKEREKIRRLRNRTAVQDITWTCLLCFVFPCFMLIGSFGLFFERGGLRVFLSFVSFVSCVSFVTRAVLLQPPSKRHAV